MRSRTAARVLFPALVGGALLAPATPAHAATVTSGFITMVSDTGDPIGTAQSYAWIAPGDAVTASGTTAGLTFTAGGFTFSLKPPTGSALTTGEYAGAERFAVGHPGIYITSASHSCDVTTGRFTIEDLAFLGDGTLDRVSLTYEQHCEGGTPAAVGQIRINEPLPAGVTTAPTKASFPQLYPHQESRPVAFTLLNTGAAPLTVGTPSVTGTAASSFLVVGNDCTAPVPVGSRCRIQVRFVPATGGALVAALVVPTDSAAGQQELPLTGSAHPGTTDWAMSSELGDHIGVGEYYSFTPATSSTWQTGGNQTQINAWVETSQHHFYAHFEPGANDVLLPGKTYTGAAGYPFNGAAPGMEVSGDSRGCNTITGSFTVGEISFNPDDSLKSFSVSFVQHCEGIAPALRGTINYRSPAPLATPQDKTPPPGVTEIVAHPLDQNLLLTWRAPTVEDYDHAVVRVALSRTAPPTSPTAGYSVASRAFSSALMIGDPSQDYAFSVFPVDKNGNVGPRVSRIVYGSDIGASTSGATLRAGYSTSISYRVVDATSRSILANRYVSVYSRANGTTKWLYEGDVQTTYGGSSSFFVAPKVTTQYLLRYLGEDNRTGAQTGPLTIRVAPALSLAASATSVAVKHTVKLTARTSPACPGVTVKLQRLVSGKWTTTAYHALSSTGAWTFSVTPGTRGTYYYRVLTTATSLHAAAVSSTRTLKVT